LKTIVTNQTEPCALPKANFVIETIWFM